MVIDIPQPQQTKSKQAAADAIAYTPQPPSFLSSFWFLPWCSWYIEQEVLNFTRVLKTQISIKSNVIMSTNWPEKDKNSESHDHAFPQESHPSVTCTGDGMDQFYSWVLG